MIVPDERARTTIQTEMYEKLWHLIIPPLMTVMDDYEVRFKLLGVQIVSEMLRKAPADTLRRTGVDGLLFTVSPPYRPITEPFAAGLIEGRLT